MPSYRVQWEVTHRGQPLFKTPLTAYTCRDAGAGAVYNPFSHMMSKMLENAHLVAPQDELQYLLRGNENFLRALRIEWYRAHREDFEFSVEMHTADEDENLPLIQINNEHLIDRLHRKWPTLIWEPTIYNDGFARVRAHGARVRGDYAILQAFYWFVVLQRATHADRAHCRERESHQWKDVNKLIERHAVRGGVLYHDWPWMRAWDNLRTGQELDYVMSWAHRYGPIAAEQTQVSYGQWAQSIARWRNEIDTMIPLLVPNLARMR